MIGRIWWRIQMILCIMLLGSARWAKMHLDRAFLSTAGISFSCTIHGSCLCCGHSCATSQSIAPGRQNIWCAQASFFESSRYKYKRERHIMLSTLYAPCCCSGVPKSAPRRFLPTPSLRNQTEDNGTSVDSETNCIALEVVVLPNNKWSGTSLILLSSDSCHKLTGISC